MKKLLGKYSWNWHSYQCSLRSFYVLKIWVCNFLAKGFWRKAAHKMLVKLTPGQKWLLLTNTLAYHNQEIIYRHRYSIIQAKGLNSNRRFLLQWKGINRKQSTRWQHLSRLIASAFFSLQNFFSCYETQQLILGTGTAIWWVIQPHCLKISD